MRTKTNVLMSRVEFGSAEHADVDRQCSEYTHATPYWFDNTMETLKLKNGKPLAVIAKSSQFMKFVMYLKHKLVYGEVGYVGMPTESQRYDEIFRNLTDKRLVVIRYNKDVTMQTRQHKAFVTFVRNVTERFRICDGEGVAIESDIHILIYTDETVPVQDYDVKFEGLTDIVTEIEVGSYDVSNNTMTEEDRVQAKLMYQSRIQKRRTDTCDGYMYKKHKVRETPVSSEDVPNVAVYKTRVETPEVRPREKSVKRQKSKPSDTSAQLLGLFDGTGKRPAVSKKSSTLSEDDKRKLVARSLQVISKGAAEKEMVPNRDNDDFPRQEFPARPNSGNKSEYKI